MRELLSRDEFREGVFKRDKHSCVVCGQPAQDAHHIIERRLWPDGGYYIANGASVCGECHLRAERNEILPWQFRKMLNLPEILPPQLAAEPEFEYNKWGDPIC